MKKIILFLEILLVTVNLNAKPPKVSGNYEQGSRYAIPYDELEYPTFWYDELAEDLEQESWAYNFEKGYLQLSQNVNKDFRYTFKYNYIEKDFFAATTNNRNRLDYYRAYSWFNLPAKFRLKTEYYLRTQVYTFRNWDNLTHVPHVLLQWKPSSKRVADLSLRYKAQRYEDEGEIWKDKNQVDSYLGYKEKLNDHLTLKAKYRYTFRKYPDNPTENNAVKKSFSAGFDYQF